MRGNTDSDGNGTSASEERSGRGDRDRSDQQEASTAQKVITAISIVFTLLVFGYVAWQTVTPAPGTHPQAEVLSTERLTDGSVAVEVRISNPSNVGLLSATVEVECAESSRSISFSDVPAVGQQTGVVACPSEVTNPEASVANWIPA